MIVSVGVSYRETPVGVRERLALDRDGILSLLRTLVATGVVREAVCLSTCNRVEVYAASAGNSEQQLDDATGAIVRTLGSIASGGDLPPITGHLKSRQGNDAMLHLCRVASSLDSLVVGEPQILGQVKDAFELAREAGTLGRYLDRAMCRALHVAKRIRTETAIGAGQVSVSSIAVDLARQIFGDLQGHAALLLGAGEMAEAAARLLRKCGARLVVVNRSLDRATALANALDASARPWDELASALVQADVVIASTGAREFIVTRPMTTSIMRGRRGRSLFFIDIAVPRNVDPTINQLDNVFVYDIDSLSQAAQETIAERRSEAVLAEQLIEREAEAFQSWVETQRLTGTIIALRSAVRAAMATEMDRSFSGKLKHLSRDDRAALVTMADAATKRILHAPLTRMKALVGDPRGARLVKAIEELFDLPRDDADADADAGSTGSAPSASAAASMDRELSTMWSDSPPAPTLAQATTRPPKERNTTRTTPALAGEFAAEMADEDTTLADDRADDRATLTPSLSEPSPR